MINWYKVAIFCLAFWCVVKSFRSDGQDAKIKALTERVKQLEDKAHEAQLNPN